LWWHYNIELLLICIIARACGGITLWSVFYIIVGACGGATLSSFFCIITGKVREFKSKAHATLSWGNVEEALVFNIGLESW